MKIEKDLGNYLSVKDVSTGDFVKIIGEGEMREKEDFKDKSKKRQVLELPVETPMGDRKTCSLNGTSKGNLIDAYGDDTSNWVGKQARVEIANQKVGSEFKDVLYLTDPTRNLKGDLITR